MAAHDTLSCEDFLDLAASVALDAGASDDDLKRVEAHAADCPDCAVWLDEFRETAGALGLGVAQIDPPPALRGRLVQAAHREPRPIVRRLTAWRPRISAGWVATAASLAVSAMALARVVVLQGQVNELQRSAVFANDRAARYERVVDVLASDRLAIRPLQPVAQDVSTRGMVYLDPNTGMGMVMCHDLPPIPQGHAYQVWFVRGNERVSGGMLWPDQTGTGYTLIKVPADLQSFDSLGLTDEPGTGSAWPTSQKVVGTSLKESSQ